MKTFTAIALWLTAVISVSVMWVQARWPTTLPEVMAFGLAAIWAVAGVAGWVRPRLSFAMVPLMAILAWAGFQMAIGASVYQWQSKVALLYWSANVAFFFVSLQVCTDARLRTPLLQALVAFAFVIAIVAPIQALDPANKVFFLFDLPRIWWIPFGPFPYTNQYAALVELLLPFALYRAITDRRWRTFHVVSVAILYTSVIAAASRAGFVLTTVEMLLVPAIVLRRHRIPARAIGSAGLLFGGIFVMLAIAAGPARLWDKINRPDPYAGRREFVESSLKMIADRPILGVGLGNWSVVYPSYAVFDNGNFANQAHNDWAQWTVEGGLPLLAIMLTLAVWAVPRALRSGWGAGVPIVLLHCLVDYPIQRTAVAIVFFVVLGAVAAARGSADSAEI
jgi:O-antigen ligase